jgi:hypothetical protein
MGNWEMEIQEHPLLDGMGCQPEIESRSISASISPRPPRAFEIADIAQFLS